VIAEGIETEEMLGFVRDPGTTSAARPAAQDAQGYLLGRPGAMPTGERPAVAIPPAARGAVPLVAVGSNAR